MMGHWGASWSTASNEDAMLAKDVVTAGRDTQIVQILSTRTVILGKKKAKKGYEV